MSEPNYQRILVVRLGALGDLVLCSPAFQAIREAYPRAIITLLTQPVWVDFARSMPWFDHVMTDARPEPWSFAAWLDLLRRVRESDPQMVFDLQGKRRQSVLYGLLRGPWGGVDWSGAAWRCKYPRIWPPKANWHFRDFIAGQLRVAHVPMPAQFDFDWLDAPVTTFNLPQRYVLLIPGCAPTRPEKRWPYYGKLARQLLAQGVPVVMIGTKSEADVLAAIKTVAPDVVDLGGKTSLLQIGAIARHARAVVGNDTGPAHIAAAVGAPTLSLFTGSVNPIWSAPQGAKTIWLQENNLSDLTVTRVMQQLQTLQSTQDNAA
jgi:ADP-heptose:LPS heptosyltransferase